ncbi:hypothetical protein E2C01_033829 [Portunus trituberculatus]|uniref:Uncharacterized protein n=1 Tax=Portunus trituberculatus TaxID=210409 RepID=A0A5B7F159_PORTR|nr:hypothetical protein [Portunus trituberculatus]
MRPFAASVRSDHRKDKPVEGTGCVARNTQHPTPAPTGSWPLACRPAPRFHSPRDHSCQTPLPETTCSLTPSPLGFLPARSAARARHCIPATHALPSAPGVAPALY